MKKTLLLTSLLLALTVSVALAGGVNIAWGTLCYAENPVGAMTFACASNSGSEVMTTSFILDAPVPDMIALEWAIEGQSDLPALPDWWKLGVAPDCRAGKATFNSNFTSWESATCVDWTAGAGFNAPQFIWDTNMAHITLGVAIDGTTPFSALAGQEYYGGAVTILNSKTVGTGACTGCSAGMMFGLKYFSVVGKNASRVNFYEAVPGGNQCARWNGSPQPCAEPVEARNTTWGQVKSLYR